MVHAFKKYRALAYRKTDRRCLLKVKDFRIGIEGRITSQKVQIIKKLHIFDFR